MTIQALAPESANRTSVQNVAGSAESRPPLDPVSTGRRPLPDRWCYACWYNHDEMGSPFADAHPATVESLQAALTHLAYGAIPSELGMPPSAHHWRPGDVEAVRALVAELEFRIHLAERAMARR